MAGNSLDAGRTVTSKVVAILTTFAEGEAHPLSEICRLTGLPVSTTHRLVTELTAHRILARGEDGTYRVGAPLRLVAAGKSEPSSIAERAPPVMEDLSRAMGARVRLGVFRDLQVAYIEKCPGHQPVTRFSAEATLPAHATALGKALLAFADPELIDLVIAHGLKGYTPYTLTTPHRFRRALALTRLTRVAICRRELDPYTAGVAVPISGPGGQVVAALSMRARDPDGDLQAMRPALTVASRCLSRQR